MTTSDEDEAAAIMAVIEAETAAFFAKEYDGWAALWVHSPHAIRCASFADGGVFKVEGWNDVGAMMKRSMAQSPEPNRSAPDVRRENVRMEIATDMAWVMLDQIAPVTGDTFDMPARQFEMRVLRKLDGQWRLLSLACLHGRSQLDNNPWIEVDDALHVRSMTGAARERLRAHATIRVANNRLYAQTRRDTEQLKQAVAQAGATLENRNTHAIHLGDLDRGFTSPIILGEEDAAFDIVWVVVDDRKIFVTLDDRQRTDRRLAAARDTYKLSPVQTRLAELLIDGDELAAAARALGISINTARTHLQRMFDKTGVHSQPALISALLSIDPPIS